MGAVPGYGGEGAREPLCKAKVDLFKIKLVRSPLAVKVVFVTPPSL